MPTTVSTHAHDGQGVLTHGRPVSHQDRRVDVQTDVFTATDADARSVEGAFVIVLANHKGGVTKTTSTANLGVLLAEAGRRVLIVDCDPQANLSEAFGWTEDLPGERLEDLLARPDVAGRYAPPFALQPDIGTELGWRGLLRIIPSTDALADVAADLPVMAGEGYAYRLAELLVPLRERFDLILLDTPPGRGNLSGMAVLAADGLLIPALAADLDVRGAGKLYDLVEGEIPGLRILGVLIAASERRLANSELESLLIGLLRKELIRPHQSTFGGDSAFRFRHLLIRDAAYISLPKGTRAVLHERFAQWLENEHDDISELDEIAGWHMEQCADYRRQLGREIEPELGIRTAQHLRAAGRLTAARGDPRGARNLLERAYGLAPEPHALRVQIGVDLAEQLLETGELTRADELLTLAEKRPDHSGEVALIRLEWLLSADPHRALEDIEAALPSLLKALSVAGDERGLAMAHLLAFQMHWVPGQGPAAAEHALLAAEHARKAGDEGLRCQALAWFVSSLKFGPESIEAIEEKLDAIDRENQGPYLTGRITGIRGVLARNRGQLQEARQLIEKAIDIQLALGLQVNVAQGQTELADLELLGGNLTGALRLLLNGDAVLATSGERAYRSTTQANLARVYERLGDIDAARVAIERSDELGGDEDILNVAITHPVRARLALAEGDASAAERWARSAVERASRTEWTMIHAETRIELARVLQALGATQQAIAEAETALALFTSKGDKPGATSTQALLDEISQLPRPAR